MRILYSILFLIFPSVIYAQAHKELKSDFLDAEYFFLNEDYSQAVDIYVQLCEADISNKNYFYRAGVCYIKLPFQSHNAIKYLKEAVLSITDEYREGSWKETNSAIDAYYYLGYAYQLNYRFDEAIEAFQQYRNRLPIEDIYSIDKSHKEIRVCLRAKNLLDKQNGIHIHNIGKQINTPFAESNPCVSEDNNTMVFARAVNEKKASFLYDSSKQDATQLLFKILLTKHLSNGWSSPEDITEEVGSKGHFLPVSLSAKGDVLLLFRDNYKYGGVTDKDLGALYISNYNKDKASWSKAEKLSKNINSWNWETHASLSPDGNALYFTSDRPGGYGGLDIYVSHKDVNGEWQEPENLGETINSKFDEDCPFITRDSVLCFASQCHDNIGNSDILYSKLFADGKWSVPVNAGIPINSPGEDRFLVPVNGGQVLYYALEREGGYETFGKRDIYEIILESPDTTDVDTVKQIVVADSIILKDTVVARKEDKQVKISGVIKKTDNNDLTPIVNVVLNDVSNVNSIENTEPDYQTGKYTLNATSGQYILNIESQHFKNVEKRLFVSKYHVSDIQVETYITPLEVQSGEYLTIKAIFFDYGSSELNREALITIERLFAIMEQEKELMIEVSGHTDSKGSVEFNRQLSARRCQSVVKYMTKRGVASKRFIQRIAGEYESIARNTNADGSDNPEGRKLNRRVEIKILNPYISNKVVIEKIDVPENLKAKKRGSSYSIIISNSDYYFTDEDKFKYGFFLLPELEEMKVDERYVYYAGEFAKKSEALQNLNTIVDLGYSDARLVDDIELAEILKSKIKKEHIDYLNVGYSIQVGAYRYFHETKELFADLKNIRVEKDNKIFRYYYGQFTDYSSAKKALLHLQVKGYYDAFIVESESIGK